MSEHYSLDSAAEIKVYLDGKSGKNGKSAYEYAVEGGYTGTEDEFKMELALESLTGKHFTYWSSVPELVSNYDNGIINSGRAQTGDNAPSDMAFPAFIISGSISSGTKEFLVIDAKGVCWKGLADLSSGTVTNITKQTSGGSEYTLPIASPNQLGGVQPVAKDDTMTQAVGVDENGGLFTVPAPENDTPDIPTPAETDNGKYLGVNNGAYALLDAPSGGDSSWTVIADLTLEEDTSSFKFTTDINGNSFEFSELLVSINPICDTDSSWYFQLLTDGVSQSNYIYYDVIKNENKFNMYAKGFPEAQFWQTTAFYAGSSHYVSPNYLCSNNTKVRIPYKSVTFGGGTLKTGSVIQIWGR